MNTNAPPDAGSDLVALPLICGDEFLGVLVVCASASSRLFSTHIEALSVLADQASVALRNVRVLDQEKRARQEAQDLVATARAISSSLELDSILSHALRSAVQALPDADRGLALLVDPVTGHTVIRAAAGHTVETLPDSCHPFLDNVCSDASRKNSAQLIPDVALYPGYDDCSDGELGRVRSAIIAPLHCDGDGAGALLIENSHRRQAFDERDAAFVTAVADLIAGTLDRVGKYRSVEKQFFAQETVAKLHSALNTAGTAGAFSVIIDGLRRSTDSQIVNLLLLSDGPGGTPVRYSYSALDATPRLPDLRTLMRSTLESGQYDSCADLGPDDESGVRRACFSAGLRSLVTAPIVLDEEVIGGINLLSQRPDAFGQDENQLLHDISEALTTVARNERLLARESERRQAAESLLNAVQVIGGTLYADIALDRIVEQMHDLMHSDCCNIMLLSENRAQVVRWRGYDAFDIPIHGLALKINDHPSLMQMLLDGQPVLVDDIAADPSRLNWYGQQQLGSYVGAPILAQNIVIGFLNIEGTRRGQFPPTSAERLKTLADTAAMALENAGLYRQLHNYAERMEEQIHERTAQLQALYAQLETVLDIASDGIVVIDSSGDILRTNAAAEQWLGSKVALDEAVRLRQLLRELVQRVHERPRELLKFDNVELVVQAVPLPQSTGPKEAAVIGLHAQTHVRADDKARRPAHRRPEHT